MLPSFNPTLPPPEHVAVTFEREPSLETIQAPLLTELAWNAADGKGRVRPLTTVVYCPFSPLELALYQQEPIVVAALFETILPPITRLGWISKSC